MAECYSLAQNCRLSLNIRIISTSSSSSRRWRSSANFAGYRDSCRLLKFSSISLQWHVLPAGIFVFWFAASNPDDETNQDLTGSRATVKSTNLQHSAVAIPRCHYCKFVLLTVAVSSLDLYCTEMLKSKNHLLFILWKVGLVITAWSVVSGHSQWSHLPRAAFFTASAKVLFS